VRRDDHLERRPEPLQLGRLPDHRVRSRGRQERPAVLRHER
jgi:hypothetical protein